MNLVTANILSNVVDIFTYGSTNFLLPTPSIYSSYSQILSTSLLTRFSAQ